MRRNFTPSAFVTGLPDSVTAEASFAGTNTVAVVLASAVVEADDAAADEDDDGAAAEEAVDERKRGAKDPNDAKDDGDGGDLENGDADAGRCR